MRGLKKPEGGGGAGCGAKGRKRKLGERTEKKIGNGGGVGSARTRGKKNPACTLNLGGQRVGGGKGGRINKIVINKTGTTHRFRAKKAQKA